MDFYLYLHVSEGVPVRKKDEILAGFIVFPRSSWHFDFMREHSLVELTTEHDDSAANIIVDSIVVVVVVFTLKAVPVSTQYFLTSVLVQLTRTPSVVTG